MRILVWFSCGAASAVAAKLAVDKYAGLVEVLYCDTLKYEHPDNPRFMSDVEEWIGHDIQILRNPKYSDIYDVFDKSGFLVGPWGAKCTLELKKAVREAYQREGDIHIFGYTADEPARVHRMAMNWPEIETEHILVDKGLTKADCIQIVQDAGIKLPAMYLLGFSHNNCIECVKGGLSHFLKVRKHFPESFNRMAAQERKMGNTVCKLTVDGVRKPIYLDELPEHIRTVPEEQPFECGPFCQTHMIL